MTLNWANGMDQVLELARAVQNGFVQLGTDSEIEPGALWHRTAEQNYRTAIGNHCSIAHGAIIYNGAEIGDGCRIGHYAVIGAKAKIGAGTVMEQACTIGDGVCIGSDNKILPHSTIINRVEIGDANTIGPFISIGTQPQHTHVPISSGRIQIGSHNVLREYMTIHLPTKELTWIGNHCFMMAYNHIPHDAQVHDHVTIANNCQIGGHTVIQHHANLGLSCVIHQFSVIGAGAMVAMGSVIIKDIPPYVTFVSGVATKLNRIGLQRNGKSESEIESLRALYASAATEPLTDVVQRHPDAWWYSDLKEFSRVQTRITCDYTRVGAATDD